MRNFVGCTRKHDQDRREDEYDQRVFHERGAGLRRPVCERQRERDGVIPGKWRRHAPERLGD